MPITLHLLLYDSITLNRYFPSSEYNVLYGKKWVAQNFSICVEGIDVEDVA